MRFQQHSDVTCDLQSSCRMFRGVPFASMLPRQAGVRGQCPWSGGQGGGEVPQKFFLCVVHGKQRDMREKWTVRFELLPTTFRPTTHRMKLKKRAKIKTSIPGIMRSGCDTVIGSSQCQPCSAVYIALRWKPSRSSSSIYGRKCKKEITREVLLVLIQEYQNCSFPLC